MKFNFFKKQKFIAEKPEIIFKETNTFSYPPEVYRGIQVYESDAERFSPFDEDYFAGEDYNLQRKRIIIAPPKTPPSFFFGVFCASLLILVISALITFLTLFSRFGGIHRTVSVPSLVSLTEAQALELLEKSGDCFNYKITYANNPTVPEGTVISQSPIASTQRKLYGINGKLTLSITVSKKSTPVTIPSLVGQSLRDVELELKNAGINVITDALYSRTVATGKIITQSKEAGSKIYPSDTVTLTVSLGPPIKYLTVPNVIGLSESKAISLLTIEGFKVNAVIYNASELPAGTVISQSVDGGTTLRDGSPIALTVSLGASKKVKDKE